MTHTTADFIQMIKDKYDLPSRYKVAQLLDKTDAQVASWAKGRTTFDDETALIIADKLEIDPAYIITCCQIERAVKQGKFGAAGVYRRILQRLEMTATTGAAAMFAVFLFNNLPPF
ncbi:helix-turn-helix transcriptional regulator [Saccharospirillum sp. HFRX-1]|uniref:helix-turn-helix domain-containing protein n=1 Tax=unclassified Saccharospirillum TaxID=2633430 RepID=UPI00371232F6